VRKVVHDGKIRKNAGKSPANRGEPFLFDWVGEFGMKEFKLGKKPKRKRENLSNEQN
jgi:hypothetical protein